ncbi:MAG: hypothetical protein FJX57_02680 [Alphaproteobacteria bacterium]|nr:hypothetical protein [Alphaproteobacteria bacterium]
MKYAAMAVIALGLSACADRPEPGGSLLDPLCMPDGSVVLWEYARKDGTFDETTAKKENCIWYRRP